MSMRTVLMLFLLTADVGLCVNQLFFRGSCWEWNLCHDICLDIADGGHTCDCQSGSQLQSDGITCVHTDHSEISSVEVDKLEAEKGVKTVEVAATTAIPQVSLHTAPHIIIKKPNATTPKPNTYSDGSHGADLNIMPAETNHVLPETGIVESGNSLPRDEKCAGLFCINRGRCVKDTMSGTVRCRCPIGFGGDRCEKDVSTRFPKFRGESFLAFPGLRNVYETFKIHLEFRPETGNGLLLFVGERLNGHGDFFSVALVDQGYIEFRFDCGTGKAIIRSRKKVLLRRWNSVVVFRQEQEGWLKLNGEKRVPGKSKGPFSRITVRTDFFLGGHVNSTLTGPRTGIYYGFVGCVKVLSVNEHKYDMRKGTAFVGDAIYGADVGDCSARVCARSECTNGGFCTPVSPDRGICMCPRGFAGKTCSKFVGEVYVPKFLGHSYLKFEGLRRRVLTFTEIEIVFKPESRNGLLFYNGYTTDRRGDFMSLALVGGYVEFRFDLGTGPAVIRSARRVTMDEWHVVVFTRTGRDGVLVVDSQSPMHGLSVGAYTQLTLMLDMFVGGHENYDDTSKYLGVTSSFRGCIQKVVINDTPLNLLSGSLGGVNIDNCEHPCSGAPCMHNGACLPEKEGFTCNCHLGYENTNCETKSRTGIMRPMFRGNSYLSYTSESILKRVTGSKIDIQIRVKLSGENGLIFWSGEDKMTSSSDYVAIGFVEGYAQFGYNLGSGEVIIVNNKTRLDDGKWHWIRAQRDKQAGWLEVDWRSVVEGSSPGSLKQLNIETPLYIGGAKDIGLTTMRKYSSGFSGCMSNLTLATDYHIDLIPQADDGRNIQGCSLL